MPEKIRKTGTCLDASSDEPEGNPAQGTTPDLMRANVSLAGAGAFLQGLSRGVLQSFRFSPENPGANPTLHATILYQSTVLPILLGPATAVDVNIRLG